MSDPFASLLNSFKNPPKNCDGVASENSRSDTPLSSLRPMTPTQQNNSKAPLDSLSITNPAVSTPTPVMVQHKVENLISDDFEDLFGLQVKQPEARQDIPVQDDLDAAFSAFEQSPAPHVQEPDVIDEVRDMEVARLMSLGYSIDRANHLYETGMLYEDVVQRKAQERAGRTHEHKLQSYRTQGSNGAQSFASLFDNGSKHDSLFSMASDLLNKGKQIVDQFTMYPEEQNRMEGSKANVDRPPRNTQGNKLYQDKKEQIKLEPAEANNRTENLLDAFEENLVISEPAHEETLLDFETPVEEAAKVQSPLPTTQISHIELSGYNEFKERGSELFRTGDYISALQEYEKSLNTLPANHPLRIIAYSNITASQLKAGEYNKIIEYSAIALKLFPKDLKAWTQAIQDSKPTRTFRDMWPKIVVRRAEAFEHAEKYQEAFESYQLLVEKSFFNDKIMEGKRRCQKILNPGKSNQKPPSIGQTRENKTFPSGLEINSQMEPQKTYKSVQKLKEENQLEIRIEAERARLYDPVYNRIEAWKSGKADDIRYLLSNLSTVLTWCDWKQIDSSDLVMPKKVKIAYMKAVAKTHPDKIPSSLELEQKMIAENIFSTLSEAWEKFKVDNNMN